MDTKEVIKTELVELVFEDIKLTCPIEDGHRMVPVKTVCQAIGVDFPTQDSWLKQHPYFGQLYRLAYTVGADNKQRKMNCLSIFDLNTWLASINLNNRKEGSIEKQYAFMVWIRAQTMEIYKSIEVFQKENEYELQLIEKKSLLLDEHISHMEQAKRIKKEMSTVDKSLTEIREKRFTGQTALPFPNS